MAPVIPLTKDQLGEDLFFRLTGGVATAPLSTPDDHVIHADINAIAGDVDGEGLIKTTATNILEFSMSAPEFVNLIERNEGAPHSVDANNYTSYVDNFELGLAPEAYPFKMSDGFFQLPSSKYEFHAIRSAKQSATVDVAYEDFLTANGEFANNAAMYVSMTGETSKHGIRPQVYGNQISAADIATLWDNLIDGKTPDDYLDGTGVINGEDTVTFKMECGDAVEMGVHASVPTDQLYYNLFAVNGDMLVNMEALPGVIQAVNLEAGITAAGVSHKDNLLASAVSPVPSADVLEATSSFGSHDKQALDWSTTPSIRECTLKNESISGMVMQVISTASDSFDPGLDENGFMYEVRKLVLIAIQGEGVLGMIGKQPGTEGNGAPVTSIQVTVPVIGKNSRANQKLLQTSSDYQTVLRLRKKDNALDANEESAWASYGL